MNYKKGVSNMIDLNIEIEKEDAIELLKQADKEVNKFNIDDILKGDIQAEVLQEIGIENGEDIQKILENYVSKLKNKVNKI